MTVVVTDDADSTPGGTDATIAFAAGAAAERSEQAEADAAAAEAAAEQAASTAEVALDVAGSASSTAWDAQFEVEQLRERVDQLEAARIAEVVVKDVIEPPAAKDEVDEPAKDESKSDDTPSYGRKTWFGR